MIGLKGLLLLAFFGVTSASITSIFIPGVGWKVYCSWNGVGGPTGSKMQNVTITRNSEEVVVYKATETNTPLEKKIPLTDADITVNCTVNATSQMGSCALLVEPKGETKADTYGMVVSFGSPHWEKQTEVETIIDKADKPKIREVQGPGQRQTLNCSTTGAPSPSLVWTTEAGTNGQELAADSNGTIWNSTTKLWNSWSVLKPQSNSNVARVFCTPVQWQGDKLISGIQESHAVRSSGIMVKASFLAMTTAVLYLLLLY